MSAAGWRMLGQMTGSSSGEQHLDLKPSDNSEAEDAFRAAERACQIAMRQIPHEVEVSQALLIYPEGEGEKVTITEKDMAELEPGKYLGSNIVDYYIRFLERRLSPEYGKLFHFFNSFFFTRLLRSSAPTCIDPDNVDYEQLRGETKKVNLFEKDYVFIPVVESSHWSLVIICHLNSLTRMPGETMRSPCIAHLDPIVGQHKSFEGLSIGGLIRSYVLQAWLARFPASSNSDKILALGRMECVVPEVPRQDNFHDCGLYVLNYIESFLLESTSPNFSFTLSERGPHFIGPHFVREVLGKRRHIQTLIHELCYKSQQLARKRRALQEFFESTQNLRSVLFDEGNSTPCIKVVQISGPTLCTGQVSEIMYASTHEDAEHRQSTLITSGDNESLDGPQMEDVEHEVQTVSVANFNGSISESKHAPTHADSMDVQHQQPSGISRLAYEPSNDPDLQHDDYQSVSESFPHELQQPEPNQIPFMDLSKALKEKSERGKNMTEKETWVLLSCKLEGRRFCKGSGGGTHWNLICEEIRKELGSLRSVDQCRRRYDTLLKSYKTCKNFCMETGKTFSEITEPDRLQLKLATTLTEDWYTIMGEICDKASIPQKRMKLSSNACNALRPLHAPDSPALNPPPISQGGSRVDVAAKLDSVCGTGEVALRNVLPASLLSSFNENLQSTLFNLVQQCSLRNWVLTMNNGIEFVLDLTCRRLAVLQDREPRDILSYVLKLWQLKLVHVVGMVFEEGKDFACLDLWKGKTLYLDLGLYKKISEEVLCKNPHLKTYCNGFPSEKSPLHCIRVLNLELCWELEHLDLRNFPSLRSLTIRDCVKLKLVTGWEVATGLGSIDIHSRSSYCDFPDVRYLSSLKEISLYLENLNMSTISMQLSQFSQCAKLRRVEIWYSKSSSEILDLENLKGLKFLEFLSLRNFTFSSIRGLSGLQALTTLCLRYCKGLRRVPELGCLKGLTHLDMSSSSVEDVAGVEELHLLTSLHLGCCKSLEYLPFLGHLKALVSLNLYMSSVKEIPGREVLIGRGVKIWI